MAVSAFRTIVIGEPTIWGWDRLTPPGIPYSWPIASPGEQLDYSLDITAFLTDADDAIVKASVSVSPASDETLTYDRLFVNGGVITFYKAGGCLGATYLVRMRGLTQNALEFEYLIELPMIGQAANACCSAPVPDFGEELTWTTGDAMFIPARALPSVNILATGTTQIGAAIAPLAKLFVNAATNPDAGILLPSKDVFCGATLKAFNSSGVPIVFYPFADESIAGLAVNAGITIQDQSPVEFWVNQAGFLVAT